MILRRLTITFGFLGLAACGKSAKVESAGDIALSADAEMLGTRKGPIGMTDHQVLDWLTTSHRGEVELAELARERATDTEIKSLAGDLRTDHARLVREGGMLAKQLSKPNTEDSTDAPQIDSLVAWHARTTAALRKLSGDSLDRALVKTLLTVHDATLDTLKKWNGKALDPKLNTAMEKAMPIVEGHLVDARAIDERLKRVAKVKADSVKKATKLKADSVKTAQQQKAKKDSTANPRP